MYLLLSNNVVNDLIGLPLETYRQACEAEEADANEKDLASAAMTTTGRRWGHQQPQQQQQQRRRHRKQRHQQKISELTTHFVSVLKGLAMRVNAETLQFFLSFPVSATATIMTTKNEIEEQRGQEGSGRQERNVECPLYARALEFCSPLLVLPTSSSSSSSSQSSSSRKLAVQRGADEEGNHHLDDPFVRITAMSVCMNILRLVTYRHSDDDDDDLESVADQSDDDHDRTYDNEDKDVEYPISENDTNDNEAADNESRTSKMVGGVVTEDTSTNSEPCKERRHTKQSHSQHHRHHQHRNTGLPTSTPTGLLHENPPVLPLQDRIAIAEFACHPTRVSDLVSPLCVRLTTQFGQVEGMVRMMEELDKDNRGFEDENANHDSTVSPTSSTTAAVATTANTKAAASITTRGKYEERTKQQKIHIHKQRRAAERTRLCNVLQNLVANVQDELLLLDDLLKVGLISLNEQAIEMLLATFVYPMLLQPLLLPGHQYSSALGENKDGIVQLEKQDEKDGEEANPTVEDKKLSSVISLHSSAPFSSILLPAWTRSYNCSDLAPSATALCGLSVVFRLYLIRRFDTSSLWHYFTRFRHVQPGGRPIVRSRPQVTLRNCGGVSIRTDANQERQLAECGEPSQVEALYSFGTNDSTNNNIDGNDDSSSSGIDNQQVFILAPALVDILRRSAENAGAREEIGATMTRPNPYRSVILSSMAGSAEMAALQPLATSLLHAAVSSAGSSTSQRIIFPTSAASGEEALQCICLSIVNTLVTNDAWWKIKFNPVAARTLVDVIPIIESTLVSSTN